MIISYTHCICVLLNYVILGVSNAIEYPLNSSVNCGLDEFRCGNGQCIASEYLCDGKKNCTDGTDETRTECLKPEIICPKYAFRCDYGACVDGDAECNGINDCADGSDEKSSKCHNQNHVQTSINQSNCNDHQFRCDNGQCIESTELCDGSIECNDRSDETSKACRLIQCSPFTFRCAYGACIDGDKKCNGLRNCADGSDEEYILCANHVDRNSPSTTLRTVSIQPTLFTTTSRAITQSSSQPRRQCSPPEQPDNGYWKLHKSHCQSNSHCDVHDNRILEPGIHLIYKCNNGYKLEGSSDVYCGLSGSWSKIPTCVEIRCSSLSSASRIAECTHDDQWISCDASVPPRTTAKLSCRFSFRQDVAPLGVQRDNIRCNLNGEWEPSPIECVPECGVRPPTGLIPLIVNGRQPNITEFPWHATIYRSESLNGEKLFICGATIISNDLLITAAHCIYDEDVKRVSEPEKFSIMTGNIFRDYDSPLHDPRVVHKRKVKQIYINCNYLGFDGNYARDIAILHINKPFVFTSLTVPICLDRSTNDQTAIDTDKVGIVAGFGRTQYGSSSGVLQSINVPVVPLSHCKSASASAEAEKFITIDKFCAGYTNGTSVCDGDSGGGLEFNDQGLWYLRGIVSVGIGTKLSGGLRTCNNHLYSLYTKISSHISWIEDIIFKINTGRNISLCHSSAH